MKIIGYRLGMLRAPLRTPFKTALRTVTQVEDVVVQLHTDDGRVGYGSAPDTAVITGDTHASIIAAIDHHLAPRLLGADVADIHPLTALIQHALPHNSSAKAAVEIALYDLWAQARGVPLYQALGGGTPTLRTDLTISLNPIASMVADARAAVARGFTSLKIKLGKEFEQDIERVQAIHAAVGRDIGLRLDANQGWTAEHAVRVLQTIEGAGIALELIEQPVPARDLLGLRHIRERVHTPVMADESVFDVEQARALIALQAADILNIKLMKTGGITQALRIAELCAENGLTCMMGCMLESSIGATAAAHVAVARGNVIRHVDLDVSALCTHDPVRSAARFDEATITLGDAPGLGIVELDGLEALPTCNA